MEIQGRLRCQGRIVRPQMRLLPLSFEGRASVTCKDIVNTVVVFSEVFLFLFRVSVSLSSIYHMPHTHTQMAWVGTAEANPEEKPLPFPPELRFTQVRRVDCFHYIWDWEGSMRSNTTVSPFFSYVYIYT